MDCSSCDRLIRAVARQCMHCAAVLCDGCSATHRCEAPAAESSATTCAHCSRVIEGEPRWCLACRMPVCTGCASGHTMDRDGLGPSIHGEKTAIEKDTPHLI